MSATFSKTAFTQKNIIILGGAGDIGAEIARQFALFGASHIALLDIDEDGLSSIATELEALGCETSKHLADITNEQATEQAVTSLYALKADWHILVTTAGYYCGDLLTDLSVDEWDKMASINARGVFLLTRAIAKHMIKAAYGKIVHIGSSSTYFGTASSGGYAASKVVINQLTQTMAVEWGPHNIQVNTICPTVTETKFLGFDDDAGLHKKFRDSLVSKMPLKRLLKPTDIAPAVLFLASDATQFINGAIIPLDGGFKLVP